MAERLRIALLIDRFGRKFGGAEAYGVNLVEELSQRHDVTVIAHDFDHHLPVKEIKIGVNRSWPSWVRVWHFARQAKRLTRTGYDVVHSHMSGSAGQVHVIHVTPIRYRRLHGLTWWQRLFVYFQPSNLVYLMLEAGSVQAKPGARVVAVSPWLKDRLQDVYADLTQIEVIAPGAVQVARDLNQRRAIRTELGWGQNDIGCLLVARNPLRKGFATVLQALNRLPSHFKLAVVGAEPAVRDYLTVNHPELTSRVSLIPPTASVSPYYQASDIYVHATLMDSFGMAPLEAMAHGLPVVVSGPRHCGFGMYVTHRHDAWVLQNPEDVTEVAQGLLLLGTNATVRDQLLINSAKLVESLSWPAAAKKYEAIYAASIAERR